MASVDDFWVVDSGEPFPGEPAVHRPALVIGPPVGFGEDFPYRIVVPLTTTERGLDLHVAIEPDDRNGLDHTSFVQCELIRSISTRRLIHRLGTVSPVTARSVHDVVDILTDR